jgi:hypothetical protein
MTVAHDTHLGSHWVNRMRGQSQFQEDAQQGFRRLRTEVATAVRAAVRQGEVLPLRLNLQRIEWALRHSYQALGRTVWKHHQVQPASPPEQAYEKIFSEIDLLLDEKKEVLKKIDTLKKER